VAGVSSGTFWLSVPRSGFASTAMTRSPRNDASVAPSVAVIVVLPTPPLSDSTAIRWHPRSGRFTCAVSAVRRAAFAPSPGFTSVPVPRYTQRRQPFVGLRFGCPSSATVDRSR
jgi:hypothetical protein